jgi:hypothetical protein
VCVIIHLTPNAMMEKEHFVNAVHNNHHSYGIVLVDNNGKTQLIRKCPEAGKYDPEEIWKILEDNKDINRYVHLRNTTRGATDLDNTQPFQVYSSSNRDVFFFHNGTLSGFGNAAWTQNVHGGYVNSTSVSGGGISDTRDFCENVLAPALLRWHGVNGQADYLDPFFDKIIMDKQWTTTSKGMFVSNNLAPKYYGSGWTNYNKDKKDSPIIMVSNTDYFGRVTRGPALQKSVPAVTSSETFFQGQEAAKNGSTGSKNGKTLGIVNSQGSSMSMVPLTESSLLVDKRIVNKLFRFFEGIDKGLSGNTPDLSVLAKVSYEEWSDFTNSSDPWTTGSMLDFMGNTVSELYLENKELKEKLEKAQKHIESLKKSEVKNAA